MSYRAPVKDMAFMLNDVAGLQSLVSSGLYEEATPDLIEAVLEEAGKLAENVIAPLNDGVDANPAKLKDKEVTTSPGFADAYRQWVEGGWGAIAGSGDYGGQGLPMALAAALQEIWNGASLSFGLCPILSQGAVEALSAHGTDEQREKYLTKLISGEWTGTMNLTEPQAGSDLNALKTKAVPQEDGSYLITGTKIYITYGEHDMAENIIHLVLACPMPRQARKAFRCSSYRNISSMKMARSASAMMWNVSALKKSSASTAARPASWRMAKKAARKAI